MKGSVGGTVCLGMQLEYAVVVESNLTLSGFLRVKHDLSKDSFFFLISNASFSFSFLIFWSYSRIIKL